MRQSGSYRNRKAIWWLLSAGGAIASIAALLWFRGAGKSPVESPQLSGQPPAIIQFDRFSAHRQQNAEGDRLVATLRLRTDRTEDVECFVFIVARNDRVRPRLWSIWPREAAGPVVTAGGHFHGSTPSTGYRLLLRDSWIRVTASVPDPAGNASYDTVVVYVLDPGGRILLARPFRV